MHYDIRNNVLLIAIYVENIKKKILYPEICYSEGVYKIYVLQSGRWSKLGNLYFISSQNIRHEG